MLLITAGPERRAILTEEDASELQKLIPHIERVHISDAGHNIRREQYSKYMKILGSYLKQEKNFR